MSLNKALAGILAVQVIVLGTLVAMPAETRTQPASASPSFDHSQCQYPARTTNPPDGCDNSDPANPYCAVKGLPENCDDPNIPNATNDKLDYPPESQVPNTAQPEAAQCGGK